MKHAERLRERKDKILELNCWAQLFAMDTECFLGEL